MRVINIGSENIHKLMPAILSNHAINLSKLYHDRINIRAKEFAFLIAVHWKLARFISNNSISLGFLKVYLIQLLKMSKNYILK